MEALGSALHLNFTKDGFESRLHHWHANLSVRDLLGMIHCMNMSKQGFGEILNFMSGVRIVALLCAIISNNAPLCADGCVGFEVMNQHCMCWLRLVVGCCGSDL